MKLDIWFDIDCPNCYLSLKQFFRLYHYMGYKLSEDTITFYPLQLNPSVMTNTEENYLSAVKTHAYLKRHKKEKVLKSLIIQGKDEGIAFDFEKLFPVNTTKAIQLVLYVQKYEKERTVSLLLSLYKAYFEDYQSIDDKKVLLDIAKNNGLDTTKVLAMYEKGTFIKTIIKEAMRAKRLAITGVPLFIFNDDKALLGYYSDQKVKDMIVDAHF